MNNEMKIIDLLNKIANGEEMPEYIKYYDRLHQKEDTMMCCYNNIIYKLDNNIIDLLDEVEILEEEKKIPEKLEEFDIQGLEVSGYSMTQAEYLLEDGIKENREMLNWILDYLKSKGE